MTNEKKQELDALCLKFRRTLIEILHERQTGHPGGSLSVCEILTNLYFNDANISPENINHRSRDKIVLCKGHAAPMLYLAGYSANLHGSCRVDCLPDFYFSVEKEI